MATADTTLLDFSVTVNDSSSTTVPPVEENVATTGTENTSPTPQEENVAAPGNETSSLLLNDGSVATSCTFSDIDQSQSAFYAKPVNLFCSAGILVGYSENNQRIFKPLQAATLAEVLKVLLFASDYVRVGELSTNSDPWYQFFLDDAKAKGLNLGTIDTSRTLTRQEAMGWLAQLFYHYTGTDPVGFLKEKGLTSGADPTMTINRSEIVTLAYRAAQDTGSYIHYGLVGAPPPALPEGDLGAAVAAKALQEVGVKYPYVDSRYTYAARFVRMMFEKPAYWADSKSMCNHYASVMQTSQNPPAGAVICYKPSTANGNYGHVAIAIGDGTEVSTTSLSSGVTQRNIVYSTSYQGWISATDFNNQYPQ